MSSTQRLIDPSPQPEGLLPKLLGGRFDPIPFLRSQDYTDVRILTKDGSMRAHKLILGATVPLFKIALLDWHWSGPLDDDPMIFFPDHTNREVEDFLNFLYGQESVMDKACVRKLVDLLGCNREFNLDEIRPSTFENGRYGLEYPWPNLDEEYYGSSAEPGKNGQFAPLPPRRLRSENWDLKKDDDGHWLCPVDPCCYFKSVFRTKVSRHISDVHKKIKCPFCEKSMSRKNLTKHCTRVHMEEMREHPEALSGGNLLLPKAQPDEMIPPFEDDADFDFDPTELAKGDDEDDYEDDPPIDNDDENDEDYDEDAPLAKRSKRKRRAKPAKTTSKRTRQSTAGGLRAQRPTRSKKPTETEIAANAPLQIPPAHETKGVWELKKFADGKMGCPVGDCTYKSDHRKYVLNHISVAHRKVPCPYCERMMSRKNITAHCNRVHGEEMKDGKALKVKTEDGEEDFYAPPVEVRVKEELQSGDETDYGIAGLDDEEQEDEDTPENQFHDDKKELADLGFDKRKLITNEQGVTYELWEDPELRLKYAEYGNSKRPIEQCENDPDFFVCPLESCQTRHKSKAHIADHIVRVHKRAICPICSKKVNRAALMDHLKRMHRDVDLKTFGIKCSGCDQKFAHKELLQRHQIDVHKLEVMLDTDSYRVISFSIK